MQRCLKISICKKIITAFTGFIWVAGLLAAGSDSPCMPWVNFAGMGVFWGCTIVLSKLLRQDHAQKTIKKDCFGVSFRKFDFSLSLGSKTNIEKDIVCIDRDFCGQGF